MAGYAALWRAQHSGQTEAEAVATGADIIIEFGGTKPDGRSELEGYSPSVNKKDVDHNPPFTDRQDHPDIGPRGTLLPLNILFISNKSEIARARQILYGWTQKADDTPEDMEHGRYGFRSDLFPELNCVPTGTVGAGAGYKIVDFSGAFQHATSRFYSVTLTLQFNGTYEGRVVT